MRSLIILFFGKRFRNMPLACTSVFFFEIGNICIGTLAKHVTFRVQDQDIVFKVMSYVRFYDNEILASGKSASDVVLEVQGKKVKFEATRESRFMKTEISKRLT